MGNPERHFPAVVIAGTNGKGSAALILEGLARSAGLRTGLYTSPHLLDLRERMRVQGEMIGVDAFAGLVDEYRSLIEECNTTFFESLTALTLEWFRRREVDVAVLETGLGGRLDATNVVRKAGLVLTSVGLDHQELLGNSLDAIAREKLGLAESGVPFYLDDLDPELRALAVDAITLAGGEPIFLGSAVGAPDTGPVEGRLQLRQIGRMQEVYQDLVARHGWPLPDVARALRGLTLAGRYDIRGRRPRLILDTAHNSHALRRVLEQFSQEGAREERVLVFGSVHGKEIDSVLPGLVRSCARILVCAPAWYRALDPALLAARLRESTNGPVRVEVAASVREALEEARATVGAKAVLATGSNFLVAEALDRLGYDVLDGSAGLWDSGAPLRQREPGAGA